MNDKLKDRINNLAKLGEALRADGELQEIIERSYAFNPWFTPEFCGLAIQSILDNMLDAHKLEKWLSSYSIPSDMTARSVGIIMAGNLPLVGFHDFLCVYVTGHNAMIKLSGKDDILFPYFYKTLEQIDPALKANSAIVGRLEGFDYVIATGSNNSNRYFEYYFRHHPRILRKNRSSIAILTGRETDAELHGLADDIFMYFGFGCRNVSKLYVPEGYDITGLFPHFEKYKWMHSHTKYMNNYDYNRTLLLMNRTDHLANEIVMIQENEAISSPVSILYYERYDDIASLQDKITSRLEDIQCVVSSHEIIKRNFVRFGHTQKPELWDYADHVDTIEFLCRDNAFQSS